jgi:hypothetical protein
MQNSEAAGYVFTFANNNRCVTMPNNNTTNGTKLTHSACTYQYNQTLQLIE